MRARKDPGGLRWIAGTAVAGSAVLLGMLLVRVSPPASEEAIREVEAVELQTVGPLARDEIAGENAPLRDPVPLYLPTFLNSGQAEALTAQGQREPVAAFLPFAAKLNHRETGLRVEFPPSVEPPSTPVQAYDADRGGQAFRYLGKRDADFAAVSARLGSLQVVRADTGKVVLETDIPRAPASPAVDWAPLELVAAVNQAGLIGMPAIVTGSGVPAFDGWVVNHLASEYRLGERLGPGIYRISLGP